MYFIASRLNAPKCGSNCLTQGFLDFTLSWHDLQQQQETFKEACKWKYKVWLRQHPGCCTCMQHLPVYTVRSWCCPDSQSRSSAAVTHIRRSAVEERQKEWESPGSPSLMCPTLCLSVRPGGGGGLRVEAGELSTVLNPRRRTKKKKRRRRRWRWRRRRRPPSLKANLQRTARQRGRSERTWRSSTSRRRSRPPRAEPRSDVTASAANQTVAVSEVSGLSAEDTPLYVHTLWIISAFLKRSDLKSKQNQVSDVKRNRLPAGFFTPSATLICGWKHWTDLRSPQTTQSDSSFCFFLLVLLNIKCLNDLYKQRINPLPVNLLITVSWSFGGNVVTKYLLDLKC